MSLVLTIVNAWRPSFSRLQEVADFGSNPGALRMLTFLPDNLSPRPALVVVLHGSIQSAADYDHGAGWSTLADQHGFALLMPEQSKQNNLTRSFNWFRTRRYPTRGRRGTFHNANGRADGVRPPHRSRAHLRDGGVRWRSYDISNAR